MAINQTSLIGEPRGRTCGILVCAIAVLSAALCSIATPALGQISGCNANAIVCENSLPGSPSSVWDLSGAGDASIQGFATDISFNAGDTVSFKVNTDATSYKLDIYRMGYYAGNGARLIATIPVSLTSAQSQPACITDSTTALIDCGNWAVSASWTIPPAAPSGIYFAKLTRSDTGGASHIVFVVRNDSSTSAILFKTSDTTWQAYNDYGGANLYTGGPGPQGGAYKVSYNRPFHTRVYEFYSWVFNAEYPMVRWLEANGYDVSYISSLDADRFGSLILQHKALLSVGHDEYWSGTERTNVEAARAAGVHLGFFSSNEIFWKTRWESSIDGKNTANRTLVCYKETHANKPVDPQDPPTWTGTWRDPRFSPPADGGRPENALSGTIFWINGSNPAEEIQVPQSDGQMRFWRGTTPASLAPGQTYSTQVHALGFEWDIDADNGFRPAGLVDLSTATYNISGNYLLDFGSTYGNGTATHHMTMYRSVNGNNSSLIFSTGTSQWPWGLDGNHDGGSTTPDVNMQQATVNLFADMGIQPATLQAGLVAASASTDTIRPISTITSPMSGATVQSGALVIISGTASDSGGVVAGVEVSVDGGVTWHAATGRNNWSYNWTPGASGTATIRSRAVDDSGNIESPTGSISLTIAAAPPPPASCPCGIWSAATTPTQVDSGDQTAGEYGFRFRSDVSGTILGIRFYKSSANDGTHIGHLWTNTGTLLGTVTFSGESSTGWQQANFSTPVPITANTTYVASYFAPNGHYSVSFSYFLNSVDNAPLHALKDGIDGPNGVFSYSASSTFPVSTFNSGNYWVDVAFVPTGSTTPPAVTSVTPAGNSSSASLGGPVTASFNESMNASTINGTTFLLLDPLSNPVPANVTYNSAAATAGLTPTVELAPLTTYTATAKGGSNGVKDFNGNALATNFSWSFTTGTAPVNSGPGGPILVLSNVLNPFSRYYGEILSAEGLNEYTVSDISTLTAATLANYDVVILGDMLLTSAQATLLTNWVNGGGKLIAMHPDKQLAGLLGLTPSASTLSNAYLLVNTSTGPGVGIVGQSIQFHGTADMYTLSGASSVATLYSNGSTATNSPAVSLSNSGAGQAAAFTYDLARSIVYTRQGNPAWSGQARDAQTGPIRSDDLFFGAASFDPQPDWVDLTKVAIPQADEQQRLLANLILQMNAPTKPLPRFWYFPSGFKAAVVMTGDDHGSANSGSATSQRFSDYIAASPTGCSVADWQCVRATAYLFPQTLATNPLTNSQVVAYTGQGFEVGVHVDSSPTCSNWTPAGLDSFYTSLIASFVAQFPGLPASQTHRMHCIGWSDYDSQPQVELKHGIRFDTTYYYWPSSWVNNQPGMFTGSGMPMRFTDRNGNLINVYQATTQMTDESGQFYPFNINTLLDNALGATGYYGAFVVQAHNDQPLYPGSAPAIVASAQAHGAPIVSSLQMLTWLDGRNSSSFGSLSWNSNVLSFTISVGTGARNLLAMLPTSSTVGTLTSITLNGAPVSFTTQTIKGVQYAFFNANVGSYQANYLGANNDAYSVIENTTLSVVAPGVLGNDSNPGGGTLTAVNGTQPTHGTLTLKSDGSFTFTPNTGYTGSDTFKYQASSGGVLSNVATVTITVTPTPPVAQNDTYSVAQGNTLNVAAPGVLSNDGNPGGGTLTAVNGSQPSHGTLALKSDGSFTYTPNTGYIGSDSFTYQASSGGVLSNTATVTITVIPPGPVAQNDAYSVAQGGTLNVAAPGVLSNDSNPGGGTLTAVVGGQPAHGTLSLQSSGAFTYTPTANYNGSDSFTYQASSGGVLSNTATVTVTVTPTPPVAQNDTYSVAQGSTLNVAAPGVLSNDRNPGGGTLTAVVRGQPAHGTLSLQSSGAFTYTPTASYNGSDSFTYQASSGGVLSSTATVTITVTPLPPATPTGLTATAGNAQVTLSWTASTGAASYNVKRATASGGPYTTVKSALTATNYLDTGLANGTTYYYVVSAVNGVGESPNSTEVSARPIAPPVAQNDSYSVAQGHTLTVAAPGVLSNDSNPGGGTLTALQVSQPAHGTLSLQSNGSFTYTPTILFSGSDSFTYQASNGALSNIATVTIFVTSASPVAQNDAYSVIQGNTLNVSAFSGVLANDTNPAPLTTMTAVLVSLPAHGALSLQSDGSFTFTPVASFSGSDSFTYQASNGKLSNIATVTITVQQIVTILFVTPTSVKGGTTATGMLTLSGPAPSGGTTVSLSSSNTTAATVPATVTVPANATTTTFTVTTHSVTSTTTVTFTSMFNNFIRVASLTITP